MTQIINIVAQKKNNVQLKRVLLLEKKVNSFSIDEKYNYGLNISSKICILPNLNLDFAQIEKYYEKLGKIK